MSLAVIRCLHRVSVVFNLLIIHEVLVIVIMLCCCPNLMLLLLYCVKEWIQACIMCICLKNKNPKQAAIKAASSGYRFSLARPLQNSFFKFFLTEVDLVLVSRLLQWHWHIVTGAQMSVERAGGQKRGSVIKWKGLFIYLPVYLFSLSLACCLGVEHGCSGPREWKNCGQEW